jgi:alkyldihydroxyacetonephosphate synthase
LVASGHSSHSYGTGTNIYFTFAARPDDTEGLEDLYWHLARRHGATLAAGGTISHHHGIGRSARLAPMELGSAYPLLAALRRALDPLGIMNPGALLPESGSARA